MDKNATIYIAGHTGLVGSAILRTLKAQGYTNFVLKTHAELDLTDDGATEAFFAEAKPDYVFLAAAKVGGIYANNTYRADFIVSNLAVQSNVITASYNHGVKKLLFLGSSCIYPKDAPQPIHEDSLLTSPLEYTNEPYAIAKIAGIKLIESYNIQYGTNYLSVMPTNLYGHNDNFDLEKSHVMPALIRKMILAKYLEDGEFAKAAKNLDIKYESDDQVAEYLAKYGIVRSDGGFALRVWGTGKPYREFLHVNDMAEACVHVMNTVDFADLTKGQTEIRNTQINIGTGTDSTISELAHLVKDVVGFKGAIEFDSTKPDGTFRKLLSVDKIHGLGWHHKIELEEGLKETVAWYRETYDA
jgi:GDP-L-fucose synthase